MKEPIVTQADVTLLARYAGLPLPSDRPAVIQPILQAWLPAANELNERMARDEVRGIVPCTVLSAAYHT